MASKPWHIHGHVVAIEALFNEFDKGQSGFISLDDLRPFFLKVSDYLVQKKILMKDNFLKRKDLEDAFQQNNGQLEKISLMVLMQWYHLAQRENIVDMDLAVEKMSVSSANITRLYREIEQRQNDLELLKQGKLSKKNSFGKGVMPTVGLTPRSEQTGLTPRDKVPAKKSTTNQFHEVDEAVVNLDTRTAQLFCELDPQHQGRLTFENFTELIKAVKPVLRIFLDKQDIPNDEDVHEFAVFLDKKKELKVSMEEFRYWYMSKYYEVMFRAYEKKMKNLGSSSMKSHEQALLLSIATEESLEKQLLELDEKLKKGSKTRCTVM